MDQLSRDHIPPQSFFAHPFPANLITVPACTACNGYYGNHVDPFVRNILTSLDVTENHPAILNYIGEKRNRSLYHDKGRNLKHLLNSLRDAQAVAPSGTRRRAAFVINDPITTYFMERMARGLVCKFAKPGFHKSARAGCFLAADLYDDCGGPASIQEQIGRPTKVLNFGGLTFGLAGWFERGYVDSFWIVCFYGGVEFFLSMSSGDLFAAGTAERNPGPLADPVGSLISNES